MRVFEHRSQETIIRFSDFQLIDGGLCIKMPSPHFRQDFSSGAKNLGNRYQSPSHRFHNSFCDRNSCVNTKSGQCLACVQTSPIQKKRQSRKCVISLPRSLPRSGRFFDMTQTVYFRRNVFLGRQTSSNSFREKQLGRRLLSPSTRHSLACMYFEHPEPKVKNKYSMRVVQVM